MEYRASRKFLEYSFKRKQTPMNNVPLSSFQPFEASATAANLGAMKRELQKMKRIYARAFLLIVFFAAMVILVGHSARATVSKALRTDGQVTASVAVPLTAAIASQP